MASTNLHKNTLKTYLDFTFTNKTLDFTKKQKLELNLKKTNQKEFTIPTHGKLQLKMKYKMFLIITSIEHSFGFTDQQEWENHNGQTNIVYTITKLQQKSPTDN